MRLETFNGIVPALRPAGPVDVAAARRRRRWCRTLTVAAAERITVFCLADPERAEAVRHHLTQDELERAGRLQRSADRRLFLGAHALLHLSLRRSLGRSDYQLPQDAVGKPHLLIDGAPSVAFNLSHCRGMAVCAVGGRRGLGIDVERVDLSVEAGVADSVFCAAERDWIGAAPRRLFLLWTMKEALFKLSGQAWSEAWRQRSVLPAVRDQTWPDAVTVQQPLGPDHLVALAVAGLAPVDLSWHMIGIDELRE